MPAARGSNGYARLWQVLVIVAVGASTVITAHAYLDCKHEEGMDREIEHVREKHDGDVRRIDENFLGLKGTVDEIRDDVKRILRFQAILEGERKNREK